MGEIGKELTQRLYPWGVKILYYDIVQQTDFEKQYPNIQFVATLEEIFSQSDVVSVHVPLMKATHHLVSEKLLKLMKKGALLINTARGPIVDTESLLSLLENKEISIHLAFDVFEQEPIDIPTLNRFKAISERNPELKFIFIPHNASADADTRAEMAIMFLTDLIAISKSSKLENLENLRLIPEIRKKFKSIDKKEIRISSLWI
jgi:glyoxylate reductase